MSTIKITESEYTTWRKANAISGLDLKDRQMLAIGTTVEYFETKLIKLQDMANGTWFKYALPGEKNQLMNRIDSIKKIISMYQDK